MCYQDNQPRRPMVMVVFTRLQGRWMMHLPSGEMVEMSPTEWSKRVGSSGLVTAQISFIEGKGEEHANTSE